MKFISVHSDIQRAPTKHFAPSKQRLLAAMCREVPLSNSLQRTSTSVQKQNVTSVPCWESWATIDQTWGTS